jgi:Flp pilus assembly protein TadB
MARRVLGNPDGGPRKDLRLLFSEPSGQDRELAAMSPAERAEFLSHHYKLQQVEKLTTKEAQAFQGCAWTGGFYCAGFTLAAGSSHLIGRSRLLSGAPDWVHGIVGLLGVIGALLCLGFLFPAILGFFRWVFAMRDRRRLGRVMVMPAAALERSKAGESGRDSGL